jgi:dethiobiotin synthetase
MNRVKILFVTGTDTDVGKTVVSLLVMHALAGRDAVYLKPVQTGCAKPERDSDPAFVHRHLPGGLPHGMTAASCIHSCRPRPKAPLFAGNPVDFEDVLHFIIGHATRHDITVVEGAGGVFVPITPDRTMLDLAVAAGATILVVGRAGLGTINHTLLTLEAITARGADCNGVILVDSTNAVPERDRMENRAAIENFSGRAVRGVIGHIANLRHPEPSPLAVIKKLFPLLFP